MRTRLSALLIAALLLTGLAGPAAPARAAAPLEIAVQDDGVLLRGSTALRAQAWQHIKQLHASYVRVNVYWNDVVSTPNAKKRPKTVRYSLADYDRLVKQARSNGVGVQMTLGISAPAWATSTRKVGKTNPDPKLFAQFAADMARHFKGKVGRYSILNEPNLAVWLKPVKTSAAQYRKLYALSYSSIKRASPSAKVFFGETAPFARKKGSGTQPLTWIAQVLKGAKLKTDGVAHHPYAFKLAPNKPYPAKGSVSMGSISRLSSALKTYAARGQLRTPAGKVPGIYLTEHGYFVSGPQAPSYRNTQALPVATRAKYWTQSLDIASKTSGVRQLLSYQLYPSPPRATWDTSILSPTGAPTSPFEAIAEWAQDAGSAVVQPR